MCNKYCFIFGTRPEYLKLKSLINQFIINKLNFKIIYINQHININESFDININENLIIDNIINDRLNNIGSEILKKLPSLLNNITHIIIQGDTASTFYSALTAFLLKIKIIYIEAGLRTYDLNNPFPEEGYRQMISRISDINFTPHNNSSELLISEKCNGQNINVGNSILDITKSYNLICSFDNIVIITFHRRENWTKINDLLIGLNKLILLTPHLKYIWVLHPNPILQNDIINNININKNIIFMQSLNHQQFLSYISKANFIITDSGGIQEEASFLGKFCIVLRSCTERNHISNKYIYILENFINLDLVYNNIPTNLLPPCNIYGNGNSSILILNYIINNIELYK